MSKRDYYEVLGVSREAPALGDPPGLPAARPALLAGREPVGRAGRGAVRGDPGGVPRGRRSGRAAPLRPARAPGLRAAREGPGAAAPAAARRGHPLRDGARPGRGAAGRAGRDRGHPARAVRGLPAPPGARAARPRRPARRARGARSASRSHRDRPVATRCAACGGTGWRLPPPCPALRRPGHAAPGRAGSRWRSRPASTRAPRCASLGEGHAAPAPGRRGDLIVITRVRPHPLFSRKGDHLHCEVPLTVPEAALGTRIQIPTPDGPVVVTDPGRDAERARRSGSAGKGCPRLGPRGAGRSPRADAGRDPAEPRSRAGGGAAGPAAAPARGPAGGALAGPGPPGRPRGGRGGERPRAAALPHQRGRRDAGAPPADAPALREEGPHPAQPDDGADPACTPRRTWRRSG